MNRIVEEDIIKVMGLFLKISEHEKMRGLEWQK